MNDAKNGLAGTGIFFINEGYTQTAVYGLS